MKSNARKMIKVVYFYLSTITLFAKVKLERAFSARFVRILSRIYRFSTSKLQNYMRVLGQNKVVYIILPTLPDIFVSAMP